VIGADHPQRRRRLHHPAAAKQPCAGKIVIGRKARELVPIVVDGIDARIVGALEIALKLQIIGRIGEHEIDALGRQRRHGGDAIANHDSTGMSGLKTDAGRPDGRPATRHNHDSEL
jgi:hypothetical protein